MDSLHSVSPNPQRADFLHADQGKDWCFLSVKKESGWDSLNPRVLDGLFINVALSAAVPAPSGIGATRSNSAQLAAPRAGRGGSARHPCPRTASLLRPDSDPGTASASLSAAAGEGMGI